MRTWSTSLLFGLAVGAVVACGSDNKASPDATPPDTANLPPPRVIPGGGIGDGPIDGVVNLYVIDDATRTPIAGATVRIGTIDGTTDATGLFVARGVTGPQTVIAKAAAHRAEMWVGANGANMTIDLQLATDPAVTSANVSGTITGFDALVLAAGHRKTAVVTYSQTDALGDAENNIATSAGKNICDVPAIAGQGCTFTVTSRTGHVALVAQILDHDPVAQTFTPIGWAYRTGLTVQNGVDQTGQALALVAAGSLTDLGIDFGAPPSNLTTVGGIVGIDLGSSEGILQLPQILTPTKSALRAPSLSVFAGSSYRFTGFASSGTAPTQGTSAVLRRGATATTLAAGAWLAPPGGVTLTRTSCAWTASTDAIVQGCEFKQTDGTKLLSITSFDGTATVMVPALVALPTTGALDATATALAGTLSVTSFAIDSDKAKISGAASQGVVVN